MYTDSLGRSIFCDGPMSKSAKEGDTSTTSGCSSGGATYSPYPTYSPPPSGSCPSGYHYHSESGGFCINDQENYGGTCYNSTGTSQITCPAQPTYTPYPSSCPSGQWWDSATSSCKSNTSYGNCIGTSQSSCTSVANCYWNSGSSYCYYQSSPPTNSSCSQSLINLLGTGCHQMYTDSLGRSIFCDGPMSKSAKEGDTSTTSGCSSGGATYSPYPSSSTYPSCPSGQWWDSATNSCKTTSSTDCPSGWYWNGSSCVSSGTTTPYPTTSYTPYPTTSYTPPPDPSATCSSSGGTWDGSTCVFPTPVPSEPPPPTSVMYKPYMVVHCQQLGRTWNDKICQANGLFARILESYTRDFATILKVFSF